MAKAIAFSVSSVQRIWRSHGLQPHRMRQFKLSNDARFAALNILDGAVIGRCMQRNRDQQPIRFLIEANENPRPFRWTNDPDKIIAAVKREHQALDPLHWPA